MASPALLLLMLMMMSSVNLQNPDVGSNGKIKKTEDIAVMVLEKLLENPEILTKWLDLIPVVGPQITAVVTSVIKSFAGDPDFKKLMQQMKILQNKITNLEVAIRVLHAKYMYGTIELSIINAWEKYDQFREYIGSIEVIPEAEVNEHFHAYASSKAEDNLFSLYSLIQGKGFFIERVNTTLIDEFRCHEDAMATVNAHINHLMFKSLFLNVLLFRHENTELSKRKIVSAVHYYYEGVMELYKSQWICFKKDTTYIQLELEDAMSTEGYAETRKMAVAIWKYLSVAYGRYDWMVVASGKTRPFAHFKKHTLSKEFVVVDGEALTVAVARQIKGKYSSADSIKDKIRKCLTVKGGKKYIECKSLRGKLEGSNLMEYITAIHHYGSGSHTAYEEKVRRSESDSQEEVEDSIEPEPSYVYTGKCDTNTHFIVMIKTDEEFQNVDYCNPSPCKNGGQCHPLWGRIVCECKYPYHGKICEKVIEYNEKGFEDTMKKVEAVEPFLQSHPG
ncbi:unnamed protein product [Arctogadus glacialis]